VSLGAAGKEVFRGHFDLAMALALVVTGDEAAALPCFRRLLGRDPTPADRDRLLKDAPDFVVRAIFERLLAGSPADRERLAPFLVHVRDWLERWFEDPTLGPLLCRHLWDRYWAGATDEVMAMFRTLSRTRPASVVVWTSLSTMLSHVLQTEEALAAGRRAVELDPGEAEGHRCCGIALAAAGRFEEALVPAARACALRSTRLERLSYSIVLSAAGRPDEAARVLRNIHDPHVNVRTWLSQALLAMGRTEDAVSLVGLPDIEQGGNGVHYSNLAVCLAAAGRLEEAVACQREARRRQALALPYLAAIRPYARPYLRMIEEKSTSAG